MTNAHDITLRPIIIGKSTSLMDNKKYAFDMLLTTTEAQVRSATEGIFNVKVKSANTMNVRDKNKRVDRYTDKTACHKKAIVILTSDSNDVKIFVEEDSK